MPWTIESALSHQSIENPCKLITEYQFALRDIPIVITIKLYQPINGNKVWFNQSHFIKTPTQMGPYMTSRPWNDDEASALHQVVSGFTQYYEDAVKQGHSPDASWLIPNKNF